MNIKKASCVYCHKKEESSNDVVSLRRDTDCSETSSSTFCYQKAKVTAKTPSVKSKTSKKSDHIPQTQNICKTLKPYFTSSKNLKSNRITPKKSRDFTRSKRKIVCSKKTVTPLRHDHNSVAKLNFKLPFSLGDTKSKNQSIIRNNLLTESNKHEKGDSILHSQPLENDFTLMPTETTNFEKYINLNYPQTNPDYQNEFDFIHNSSSFSQWDFFPCFAAKDTIPTVSKLSTSKPFLLKRRTYSCGILSMNDSGAASSDIDKNVNKEDLSKKIKKESDGSDDFYYSENSEVVEGSNFESETVLESKSVLNVKQPIRIKYIEETTMLTKELLIYSDEFLENLCKEKGSTITVNEIFKSIVSQCIDYKGKSLRVIPDTEEFLCNLKKISKSQPRFETSKIPKKISPQNSNKKAVNPQRRVKSAPYRSKECRSALEKDGIDKCKMPQMKLYFSRNDISNTRKEKKQFIANCTGKNDTVKEKYGRNEFQDDAKSRTALKRINFEEIISSNFRSYFQYYAKLGGRLRSGAVISRINNHFWLKRCGIIFDNKSFITADDCFTSVAKSKLVLNISDYMQYLTAVARRQRIFFVDVIQQLMSVDIQSVSKITDGMATKQSSDEFACATKQQKSKQYRNT